MRLEEDKGSPACSCRAGTTSYSLCLEARQESQLKCLDARLREARGSQFSLDVLQSLTLAKLMPAPARSCSRIQSCVLESCLAVTSFAEEVLCTSLPVWVCPVFGAAGIAASHTRTASAGAPALTWGGQGAGLLLLDTPPALQQRRRSRAIKSLPFAIWS